MRGEIIPTPTEGHSTKYLISSPQTQSHQTQGKLEKLSQPSGAHEDMRIICNVPSMMKSWDRKGTLGEH